MRSLPTDVMAELHGGSEVQVLGEEVGTANGALATFDLLHKRIMPDSLSVSVDGSPVSNVSLSAGTGTNNYAQIVFDTPPANTLEIIADYIYFPDDQDYIFPVYLLEMQTTTPQYFTNADVDIYFDGDKYESMDLDFGPMEYSLSPTVDKVQVSMPNVDLTISDLVMTSEVRGKTVIVRLAVLDTIPQVIGTVIMFSGLIDSVKVDKLKARFDFFNHMILWQKKIPRRQHNTLCQWTFKDTVTCRYPVGGAAQKCDKSWDQCLGYGNTDRFGGFRFVNSLVDKNIWWGSTQK